MTTKKKRENLTSFQLKPNIARMMRRFTAKGVSKTEIINEALNQYLVDKEIEEVRQKLIPLAQAKGIYTDQDIEQRLK